MYLPNNYRPSVHLKKPDTKELYHEHTFPSGPSSPTLPRSSLSLIWVSSTAIRPPVCLPTARQTTICPPETCLRIVCPPTTTSLLPIWPMEREAQTRLAYQAVPDFTRSLVETGAFLDIVLVHLMFNHLVLGSVILVNYTTSTSTLIRPCQPRFSVPDSNCVFTRIARDLASIETSFQRTGASKYKTLYVVVIWLLATASTRRTVTRFRKETPCRCISGGKWEHTWIPEGSGMGYRSSGYTCSPPGTGKNH